MDPKDFCKDELDAEKKKEAERISAERKSKMAKVRGGKKIEDEDEGLFGTGVNTNTAIVGGIILILLGGAGILVLAKINESEDGKGGKGKGRGRGGGGRHGY